MNITLAQLVPLATSAFVLTAMVKLGATKHTLEIRRHSRCAACGVEQPACRCSR
jgi:hypothetical protein